MNEMILLLINLCSCVQLGEGGETVQLWINTACTWEYPSLGRWATIPTMQLVQFYMTACMCLLPASAYQPCEVILSIKCTIILRGDTHQLEHAFLPHL